MSFGCGARAPGFQVGVSPQPAGVSSGCDLLRTPAEGGGERQPGCSKTHTHPLGQSMFRCNHCTVPEATPFHTALTVPSTAEVCHLPSAKAAPPRPLFSVCPARSYSDPSPPSSHLTGPRFTGSVFTGSCHPTHHYPCNEPCSPFFRSGTKKIHPLELGLTFKWL